MKTLSPSDLAAIEAAVRQAEARTTGEIYCVVTEESSHYGETAIAWAAGVALLGPALLLLVGVHVTIPDLFSPWSASQVGAAMESAVRRALIGAIVLQVVLFVLTAVIVSIPPVRRALTPPSLKRLRVRRRALEQFVAKNLHLTRERTGILIFVSLGERMAELIADEGIADHVEPPVWDRAMAALTEGLKRGQPEAGFVAAIGLCADVLAEKFPQRPGDNPDELPDAVVVLPKP
ncbi:TPM domain-containing protein [Phenylobacterium sp.]|jgi:putative membrane protein|uniref:TPM domain-containing protein n=1 Tax=Phenylobacterium sp. TaxID=1871053 RepID=UPI002E35843A|nr:TPM domain-containing protein [Phenylobacterium sp.]HEX4712428.1 TPM domain-containing protein [Phenylobacterium sp.]